jgi:hypothetical protein
MALSRAPLPIRDRKPVAKRCIKRKNSTNARRIKRLWHAHKISGAYLALHDARDMEEFDFPRVQNVVLPDHSVRID